MHADSKFRDNQIKFSGSRTISGLLKFIYNLIIILNLYFCHIQNSGGSRDPIFRDDKIKYFGIIKIYIKQIFILNLFYVKKVENIQNLVFEFIKFVYFLYFRQGGNTCIFTFSYVHMSACAKA